MNEGCADAANDPLDLPLPRGMAAFVCGEGEDEVVVFSLPGPTFAPHSQLTRAQTEIAGYVALGLSNAEIARRRGTSARTIANQLAALFQRLDIGSRAELILCCIPRA